MPGHSTPDSHGAAPVARRHEFVDFRFHATIRSTVGDKIDPTDFSVRPAMHLIEAGVLHQHINFLPVTIRSTVGDLSDPVDIFDPNP